MKVEVGNLLLSVLLSGLHSVLVAYECQQFTAKASSRFSTFPQHFKSPDFPLPRPPGFYVCEYILNPKRFSVRIIFTDFFLYGSSVQDSLVVDCLYGDGDYIEISVGEKNSEKYCAASKSRPPPFIAVEQKLIIRYVVRSNTTRTSRPGFRASYQFSSDNQWLEKPKVLSEYILTNGDGYLNMTLNGPSIFDVMLLIQSSNLVYFNFNATGNISIPDAEVEILLYDGSTSTVVASHRQTNLELFDYTSLKTTILLKINVKLTEHQAVILHFVYAFCTLSKSVGGFCPLDYFACEGSFHCIPKRLLCDSHSHCPDSSDEIYCNEPCLKCRNGGICDKREGECQCVNSFYGSQCHFYACGEINCNHGVCKIADQNGNSKCECHTGYSGIFCDAKEEGDFDPCPCEKKNRCQMYVSLSIGIICDCYENFYGPNCEYEDNWDVVYVVPTLPNEELPSYPNGRANYRAISKVWVILLTAFGILFLIIFCCCIAKRGSSRGSRSTRDRRPNNTNNRNDATQVPNHGPPLIRSSSSLFAIIAAWRRATMRPPTPPPSYDTIAPMYCPLSTNITMNETGAYLCRAAQQQDAACEMITRESSGLPDVVSDGEMRTHVGQSIVSQV